MLFLVEPRRNQDHWPMRGLSSAAFACLLLFCGGSRAADDISVEATRRDDVASAVEVPCPVFPSFKTHGALRC